MEKKHITDKDMENFYSTIKYSHFLTPLKYFLCFSTISLFIRHPNPKTAKSLFL